MFDTLLGVEPSDVLDAVQRVFASAVSPQAKAYRAKVSAPEPMMAVVVQRQVDPEVSGVMFSVNPLSGSWREMVIESVWGLGEPLVSGEVTPHWFLLRRPLRLPGLFSRVAGRMQLALMQEELPVQRTQRVRRDGAVVTERLPSERVGQRTLTERNLLRVGRMGLRVERALGGPQDVEWCFDRYGKLWLLQARPITALPNAFARDDVLWTRRFFGERWHKPATPLGWSLIEPVLDHFIGYQRTQRKLLGGGDALRLFDGRPYVNATVFRHLLFKLPGAPPPSFLLEMLPPGEALSWRSRFAGLPDVSVLRSILWETVRERRWRRFKWNPATNPQDWTDLVHRGDAVLAELAEPQNEAEVVEQVEILVGLATDYVAVHITSLLFANLSWQLLEGSLVAVDPAQAQRWVHELAICPPGNQTLRTNAAMWALAQVATEQDLASLGVGEPLSPRFESELAAFLRDFGHRSESTWELAAPRWGRRPAALAPLLRAQRGLEDPLHHAEHQEARWAEAVAAVQGAAGPAQAGVVLGLVHFTREYLLLRENQRFWFDKLLNVLQQRLEWAGELLSPSALDRAEDVWMLRWSELKAALLRGQRADLRRWVVRRAAQHAAQATRTPPTFLLGEEPQFAQVEGKRLQGLGISPGRARGTVRRLESPAQADRLQEGDILVARSVDPSWTPLFLKAAAVVVELGGLLSHGAVVAREYGVPMVANMAGVRALVDGQEIEVDGSRGLVFLA